MWNEESKWQYERCVNELNDIVQVMHEKEKWGKYFAGFLKLYRKFLSSKRLSLEKIDPPSSEKIRCYADLECINKDEIGDLFKRLVVVKLNGGLGTTMGCSFPKSLITVRNGLNFLDLTVMQLEQLNTSLNGSTPLVLMNSFSTNEDTLKVIQKYKNLKTKIYTFMQSQYPRISGDTLLPLAAPKANMDQTSWYPPGHGNFYEAFYESGLMEQFLAQGRDICFVSNIDNLGATVDLKILKSIADSTKTDKFVDFIMEVTNKTKADVKGGTLIMNEGHIHLLEMAQVPPDHVEDFKSVTKFRVFNTNNIWMNLHYVLEKLKSGSIEMDVIVNKKTLPNGQSVIQLETAIGAAIGCFTNSIGINVPRSRFLPVKSNSDLLLVMSNLYKLNEGGELVMDPARQFQTTPHIQFSGCCFKTVKDFLSRFESIPDILDLDHLTVSGDVSFGKEVSLRGTVIIVAPHGQRIDIPRGSILENKILSGNLHIVDH